MELAGWRSSNYKAGTSKVKLRVNYTETHPTHTPPPFHSLHHMPSSLHSGHGAIAVHHVCLHMPGALAIGTSAKVIKIQRSF